MNKPVKTIGIILLVAVAAIQFVHPVKNVAAPASQDVMAIYPVPANVRGILAKACYDCHSNNTRYPWYSKIQPVDWWLDSHIREAKQDLNFSEFGSYKLLRQAKMLKRCANEVNDGNMPLDSYLWIHKDAVLTDAEKHAFTAWCSHLRDSLYALVPAADKKRQEERGDQ